MEQRGQSAQIIRDRPLSADMICRGAQCTVLRKAQILLVNGAVIEMVPVQCGKGVTQHQSKALRVGFSEKGSGIEQTFAVALAEHGIAGIVFPEILDHRLNVRNLLQHGCCPLEFFQPVLEQILMVFLAGYECCAEALAVCLRTVFADADDLTVQDVHCIIQNAGVADIRRADDPPPFVEQ